VSPASRHVHSAISSGRPTRPSGMLNDREVYGKGLADQVAEFAKGQGIAVAANQGIDPKAAN
jgi:hypothetical protein